MPCLSDRSFFVLLVAILFVAALYRLYPLFAGMPALAQSFMTEDGYLMATIARNMAIGLGMSVSDGTIESNGVQPLATFLFAGSYLLADGDKVAGLWGVQLIGAVVAIAGIFSVRAFARVMLAPQDEAPIWPWLVATLWFTGPLLLLHTMNGLETGLYTVMVTLTMVVFARLLAKGDGATARDRVLLGAICGVTFLARNDAVFLLGAIGLVWLVFSLLVARRPPGRVLAELVAPALVLAAIASPWLINNYVNFGSIVPVSGTAQSLSGGWAANADILAATVFEHTFPMFPVPEGLQAEPIVQVVTGLTVAAILGTFVVQAWRRGGPVRYVMLAYVIFALLMCFYYGFTFGAGWFLSRYLAPLAPLLITAAVSVALGVARASLPSNARPVMQGLAVISLALCFGMLGRYLVPGVKDQGHFQVVEWVSRNVADDTWVGAVQTGTLGYWHDRTINLDGKVNPDALAAILTQGDVLDYVLQSPIVYLADWEGIAYWVEGEETGHRRFREAFDVVLHDEQANLAVLERQ